MPCWSLLDAPASVAHAPYPALAHHRTSSRPSALFRMMRGGARGKGQGMTDVFWALINSSEFLTNR